MQELKEGDWVRDILTDEAGEVRLRSYSDGSYPFKADFGKVEYIFIKDGRGSVRHKNPRFIKCDPPKKKVKKKVYTYVLEDKYSKGETSLCVFPEPSSFDYYKIIAEFINEFEIEE